MNTPVIYIISGHDPTCGAGMAADISTAEKIGIHPVVIPSMLTIQNSMNFEKADVVDFSYIISAFEKLFCEFKTSVIKTGLLPFNNSKWISQLTDIVENRFDTIIADPVFKASSSSVLPEISPRWIDFISGENRIITPNPAELKIIAKIIGEKKLCSSISEKADFVNRKLSCSIVLTPENSSDRIMTVCSGKHSFVSFKRKKTDRNIHGTGCHFSTAVGAYIARGFPLEKSVEKAADFMENILEKIEKIHPDGQYYIL